MKSSEMTVLVGCNGTGKSNLLEALTIIFRDLDLGERPRFSYELRYLCRGRTVTIDADPERRARHGYEVTADGKKLTWRAFHDSPTAGVYAEFRLWVLLRSRATGWRSISRGISSPSTSNS